jgi:hypothetical protein
VSLGQELINIHSHNTAIGYKSWLLKVPLEKFPLHILKSMKIAKYINSGMIVFIDCRLG